MLGAGKYIFLTASSSGSFSINLLFLNDHETQAKIQFEPFLENHAHDHISLQKLEKVTREVR